MIYSGAMRERAALSLCPKQCTDDHLKFSMRECLLHGCRDGSSHVYIERQSSEINEKCQLEIIGA
jgi:hypothetical protein